MVAFARDMVEGMLPPIVQVEEAWLTLKNRAVASEAEDEMVLLTLNPSATEVPENMAEGDQDILPVAPLAPSWLVDPLLKPPSISPPSAL